MGLARRYPLHTGINNWLPNVAVGLPLDEVTLADLLKEHGCKGVEKLKLVVFL